MHALMTDVARKKGKRARRVGEPRSTCPYNMGREGPLWNAWQDGYGSGYEPAKKYLVALVIAFVVVLFIVLGLIYSSRTAEASACYGVRDMDRRLACLAEERRDPAGCTSIRNNDDRIVCRQRSGQPSLSHSPFKSTDPWPLSGGRR
jgi:hypothetical protein